jgi:beta-glucosidase
VAQYAERRLIGYRWYDTVGREPLFPFGHGLGYAPVTVEGATALDEHHVAVRVRNGGGRDSSTVVQVYAHQLERAGLPPDEPVQRLVGFARVAAPAGVEVTATIELDRRAYQGWSVERHAWVDGAGPYELRVGTSSRAVAARLRVRS